MKPNPLRDHFRRGDAIALAALVMAVTGLALWMAAAAGAISVPSSDDWVYTQGADSLFRTGTIVMPAHSAAAVGQLVMVQPLLWLSGGDPWAFTAFGLIMTSIGITSAYLLARRFVGTGSAVIVVLLVLAFPGLARVSASFMTDVPAFAMIALCLLQGHRWLCGDASRLTLVTSLAAGLVAVSIREFAIAAPAAVLVAAWARNRAGERAWLAGASGVFVVGVAFVLIIAASIPGRAASAPSIWGLLIIGPGFATFAAVLLPALVLGIGRRMATFSPEQILVGAGLAFLALIVSWGSTPGNMWMQTGFAGDLLLSGTRGTVFDPSAWVLSRQVASFATILFAASALRWGQRNLARVTTMSGGKGVAIRIARSDDGLLVLFLLAYTAEIVGFAPFWVYDRYFVPMVPVAAILLLRGRPQASSFGRSLAFAHGALAWLMISAILLAANSFAYDAARWREGEAAVSMGYDARSVDAGYEWIGYHAAGVTRTSVPADNTIWTGVRWSLKDPCAVLSNTPLDANDLRLIRINPAAYRTYLFFGAAEPLYLYGATTERCPALPAAISAAETAIAVFVPEDSRGQ